MITVVTTYNLEIFKLFYTHKHHEFLTEKVTNKIFIQDTKTAVWEKWEKNKI